ncbi:MAG: glycosyltransferase family 1 protein [bacterium]
MRGEDVPLIAVEAHWLMSRSGGNASYTESLVAAMLERAPADLRFLFFVTRREAARAFGLNRRNSRAVRLFPSSRWVRVPVVLPLACRAFRPALFHSFSPFVPPFITVPSVATVFDVLFEDHPEFFTPGERRLFRFVLSSLKRAEIIVTISQYTKGRLVSLYGLPPERIEVAPPAAGSGFSPVPEARDREILSRHGLPERFVLYVGRLNPRKNLAALIEAYARVKAGAGGAPRLVIAGTGGEEAKLKARARGAGVGDDVLFPGYVERSDLPALYRRAEVFVYPSLGEGFGMPVLEAMACGAPVVASDNTAFPEVVGDGGMLVNPADVEEIAGSLGMLLSSEERREEMSRRARARSLLFSWDDSAEKMLGAYRRALAGS